MSSFTNNIFLSIYFSFFLYIKSFFFHERVVHLDYEKFQKLIAHKANFETKWLLLFYTEDCYLCNKAIKLLNDEIIPYYKGDNNLHFGDILVVASSTNSWLSEQLYVEIYPTFFLVEKKKIYKYNLLFAKDAMIDFIERKKYNEKYLPIPKKIDIFGIVNLQMVKISIQVSIIIELFLNYFGINIHINEEYTLSVIIAFFLFIIFFGLTRRFKKMYNKNKGEFFRKTILENLIGKEENYEDNQVSKLNEKDYENRIFKKIMKRRKIH